MKFISIVAVLLLLLLEFNNARPSSLIRTFEEFKAAYNKTYATDEQEEIARKNFLESLKYVQSKNNQSIAISHLSDLPLDEQQIKINKNLITANICHIDSNMTIPDELDLRSLRTLTPIRMQGNCASSWAFAAIASFESARLAKNYNSIDLSVQELIDCASQNGCSGDNIQRGLNDLKFGFYYMDRYGVVAESDYPYVEHEQSCPRLLGVGRYMTRTYCQIEPQNPLKIRQALTETHTAIATIIAIKDFKSFQHYDGRTIIQHDDNDSDQAVTYHAINIVGYGNFQGLDYWIIRNNWDITWGDKGYGYIAANKNLMQIEQYPFLAYYY